jgi:hypothetical protein
VAILPVLRRRMASTLNRGRAAGQVSSACAAAPQNAPRPKNTPQHAAYQGCAPARNEVPEPRLPVPGSGARRSWAVGAKCGGTSMKSRIAIAVSALTLGTALATIPSFAQTSDQSNGSAAQQGSSGCVHFQQDCSNKPYPMPEASGSSSNGGASNRPQQNAAANGARTGAYRLGPNPTYAYAPGAQFGPAASGATQWCETRFRSFDPATGTYTGFDGIRHACP